MEDNHRIPQLSATTLLILEREDQECQVFVLKRQNRGGFLQDAIVFPGGVIEPEDYLNQNDALKAAAVREIVEETGLVVDPATLCSFSWWITPKIEKRRFDTRFFVAPYPNNQIAKVNEEESQWGCLLTPSEILQRHENRHLRLLPPTLFCLERIKNCRTFAEVLAKAQDLREPICPELELDEHGEAFLALPSSHHGVRKGFKISTDGRFS